MTAQSEAEKVAASLTKAQAASLIDCDWHGSGETQFATVPVISQSYLPTSIVQMFTLRSDRVTDFGHEVRRVLLKGNPDNGE